MPSTSAHNKAPPSTRHKALTFTFGNTVVATRTNDITSNTPMIKQAKALSQGRFTHGPRTSRSLQSNNKNTAAEGKRTPANACTAKVIKPRGARGIRTITAATATSPAKLA
jgi:hypothetical protein